LSVQKPMWRALGVALIVGLLAGSAAAELVNENLLVVMPAGYKVGFQTQKNNMVMTEMVPSAETVENWTEMVTVQVFHDLKITPAQFMIGLAGRRGASCPNMSATKISSAVENGYPAMLSQLNCPNNPATAKPEITWFKALQGNDSFYLVQKAFKFAPSKEQVAQWVKYLEGVKVCDSRLPDRACPQTGN
jgi:hypothetical protein